MKFIMDYLMELPEPIKSQAIANYKKQKMVTAEHQFIFAEMDAELEKKSIATALVHAFSWTASNEGVNYWNDVANNLNQ